MKIRDISTRCLGGFKNTCSIERPIDPDTPNEIIYQGVFEGSQIPHHILDMEFFTFSVNGSDNRLRADIVFYVG